MLFLLERDPINVLIFRNYQNSTLVLKLLRYISNAQLILRKIISSYIASVLSLTFKV